MRPSMRLLGSILGLALVLVLLVAQLAQLSSSGLLHPDDFVEYWAAGRLNATGGNPYDGGQLLPLQQAAGWHEDYPIMMWNPPWTLPLVMPLGLLPFHIAQLAWLILNLGILLACADWLWCLYGGPASGRMWAWAVGLVFLPSLIVIDMGQIPPWILLGIVLFFHAQRRGWDVLAGATLALVAIKPHVVYLLGIAVLLWAVQRHRWGVLVGGVLALATMTGIAWLINPAVLSQYRAAVANRPPTDWITTTFGSLLRVVLGQEHTALQFLPSVLGVVWLVPYWWRRRRAWNWDRQLALVLLVSVITASFGWLGDQVVLLPAVVQAVVWILATRRGTFGLSVLVLYLAGNGIAVALGHLPQNQWPCFQLVYLWVAPTLLGAYLLLRRTSAPASPP